MQTLVSLCLGIGLSAACGLRVFVPLLAAGLASRLGLIHLNSSFGWMGSTPALLALGVATVLEIAAYHIPWLDHLLDVAAAPASLVAGALLTASVLTGLPPYLHWTLAIIAGSSAAGAFQFLSMGTRGFSTVTTAGMANPLVGAAEAAGSIALSVMAILLPVAALVAVLAVGAFAAMRAFRSMDAA